jgi:hypothetical protein
MKITDNRQKIKVEAQRRSRFGGDKSKKNHNAITAKDHTTGGAISGTFTSRTVATPSGNINYFLK